MQDRPSQPIGTTKILKGITARISGDFTTPQEVRFKRLDFIRRNFVECPFCKVEQNPAFNDCLKEVVSTEDIIISNVTSSGILLPSHATVKQLGKKLPRRFVVGICRNEACGQGYNLLDCTLRDPQGAIIDDFPVELRLQS